MCVPCLAVSPQKQLLSRCEGSQFFIVFQSIKHIDLLNSQQRSVWQTTMYKNE